MKALWNGSILAESNDTIEIDGNQYFPATSIVKELIEKSDLTTTCIWKGEAHYYNIIVDGKRNADAAWYYPAPKAGSIERVGKDFTNYVAFWKGVSVTA